MVEEKVRVEHMANKILPIFWAWKEARDAEAKEQQQQKQ